MTKRQKATLIFVTEGNELLDWSMMAATDSRVITVRNLNLLKDSLHLAQNFVDVEVVRVVFDQSVDAEEWLDFLTGMPQGFRGDVLHVSKKEKAFLSAVGRGDERVMYKLEGGDIQFYLEACGIMPRYEAVFPIYELPYMPAEALAV